MQKGVADYFVENYEKYLYFAFKHSNSVENAEDIMQETFLHLYKKNKTVENPVAHIKRHMTYVAADFYREYYGTRRKFKTKFGSLDEIAEQAVYDPEKGRDELPHDLANGLKQIQHGDLFYLYATQDVKMEDLALSYGITQSAMSIKLKKVKLRLQEFLKAA